MAALSSDMLLPAPLDGGFRRDDAWIWCDSVARDKEGLYHMFASMWEKTVPFAPNWLTNSMVVHATSPTPAGPYAYQEDVLPPRGREYWDGMVTHNPTIHQCRDKYLLFEDGVPTHLFAATDDGPGGPRRVHPRQRHLEHGGATETAIG